MKGDVGEVGIMSRPIARLVRIRPGRHQARSWRSVHVRVLLLASMLLAACSGKQEPPPPDAPIRIGVPVIPPAIGNPYQGITVPATLALQAIFDTVTTVDAEGNAVPALATSWRQEGELAWIFTLRPGVTFANGEPFDAAAIVESVAHMTSQRGRGETIGSTLYQIDSAERIDDLTVRIRLNEPDPLLPLHVAVWRIPAPQHWRTLRLPAGARDAVGSGPFMVIQRADGRLRLAANPRSWRRPAATGIDLVMIPDTTARLQAFVSGAVDMAMGVQIDDRAAVEQAGGRLLTRLTPQVDFIGFLTERRDTPLADVRVRRAINMAVDRAQLTRYILGDTTEPTAQLSVPGAFGYSEAIERIPYDPAGARRLLAEAGYSQGMELTMAVTVGEVAGDALFFQQIGIELRRIGIDVEIRGRPSTRHMQDLFSGQLDVDLFSWNTRGTDPLNDYRHRSCLRPTPARQPFHCDPALTNLLRQATAEIDVERRRGLYVRVAEYERDNPGGLMLWQRPDFDAVAPWIRGYAPIQDALYLERLRRVAPQ